MAKKYFIIEACFSSSVIFGEHNTKTEVDCLKSNPKLCAPPPVEIRVKSLVFHPEFTLGDNSYPNDIGIIYLKNPVTFTGNNCLPES